MAFKNKIAAPCSVCGTKIAVGAGYSECVNGRWSSKCAGCSGIVESAIRIEVSLVGSDVVFKPSGYLNGDFQKYKAACEGARYVGDNRNAVPVTKAASIVARLRDAQFLVDVAPAVATALQEATAKARLSIEKATSRTVEIDAILRSRGKSLYPFQKTGATWLSSRFGALLADDMGLGKTIQTLAALPENAPTVVVCPSVAKGVWKREIANWLPDRKVTVLEGRGSFRFPVAGEIVITNYDILPNVTEKAVNGFKSYVLDPALAATAPVGLVMIADEGHALKNSQAARTRKWGALRDLAQSLQGRVWVLTATPVLNRAAELWAILRAAGIASEAFGSYKQFVPLLGGYQGQYGVEWGNVPDPAEVGRRLARVMLRRLRTEVLPELPVKTYRQIDVKIDATTAKLCDAVLKSLAANDIDLTNANALAKLTAGTGAGFEQMSKARAALATAKIPALLELIESYEEQEEPIVVFSAHRAPIDILEGRPGWAVITGDTTPEARTAIEDAFQAGKLVGVACTIKAGGVAITLTKAAHAIFVDQEWTPALNAQAEDRICRIGQDRGCLITLLIAVHALDARIAELLGEKRTVIADSVEQGRVLPQSNPVIEVAEIDFAKLAEEASAAKAAEQAAKAQAAKLAAERAEIAAKSQEEEKKKADERKARELQEKKDQKARERAAKRGWVVEENHPDRRPALTDREVWAEAALAQLTESDPDHAAEDNGIGFNKADSYIGHWLRQEIRKGLTPAQWEIVIKLCSGYPGQVGRAPRG
jgi:hypothetical protein